MPTITRLDVTTSEIVIVYYTHLDYFKDGAFCYAVCQNRKQYDKVVKSLEAVGYLWYKEILKFPQQLKDKQKWKSK